ncbi:MAG: lytic transglycosylase domain-containing protein [Ruegeria sp.]|uniref:lytic transglycosylase domain-containing protein n=1 Tax=Ruegeria sp. TaxID=1879320 RepID=UPI00349E957C
MNLRIAVICAGALALACSGVMATEATDPSAKPVFKRIKAPKPGTRPKITVQISAEEHAAAPYARSTGKELDIPEVATLPQPAPKPAPAKPGKYTRFWEAVSPELTSAGTRQFDQALQAVSSAEVAAPRLQALQDIARAQGVSILRSTIGTKVSPALVLAVISVESAGRTDAVSTAGAQGLMQLMPATAERFGVEDSLSADQNIAGGVKYLDWLMKEFNNDPILVLAGYNAGEGAVRKHSGVPPYSETRDYVPKVLAAFKVARALCATPPELVSDGCVFTSIQ